MPWGWWRNARLIRGDALSTTQLIDALRPASDQSRHKCVRRPRQCWKATTRQEHQCGLCQQHNEIPQATNRFVRAHALHPQIGLNQFPTCRDIPTPKTQLRLQIPEFPYQTMSHPQSTNDEMSLQYHRSEKFPAHVVRARFANQ